MSSGGGGGRRPGGGGHPCGDLSSAVVRREVVGVRFGMYTDDDVRHRSVVEITSPLAFDPLGTPLPGGLYDPMMGPATQSGGGGRSGAAPCVTCGNVFLNCPGHAGHVELCVPAYHPLTFSKLIALLRMKCLNCHGFRVKELDGRKFAAMLHLIDCGRVKEATGLEEEIAGTIGAEANRREKDGDHDSPEGDQGMSDRQRKEMEDSRSASVKSRILDQKLSLPAPPPGAVSLTSHEREIRRQTIKSLMALCAKTRRCQRCKAHSPKIRQDNSNKIFTAALSAKDERSNASNRILIRPASVVMSAVEEHGDAGGTDGNGFVSDESDADSDDMAEDDDDDDVREVNRLVDDEAMEEKDILGPRSRQSEVRIGKIASDEKSRGPDKFLHALEVEAHARLTWRSEHILCAKVFGNAHMSDMDESVGQTKALGYSVFFLRAMPVPPSKFRPPIIMGTMTVEHSQNHYLAKILELNDQVRTLFATIRSIEEEARGEEPGEGKNKMSAESKVDLENTQARSISAWIDLQTKVNCLFDSSKDPVASSAAGPNGIRQLLEKKEGIFRKHMMGKRVNYACRSVISPDPYIGTNEIGVPLHFAKTLTYPTPVTGRNVEEMRNLVERGPHSYPGATWVESPNAVTGGIKRVELGKMTEARRKAVAASLISGQNDGSVRVGRQMRNGDMVLMNRQPTLHKPGIMAHKVRVLYDTTQTTLRMHYANCNTYNADFDGDEMNCHMPQNDLGRAEAEFLAATDLQYIVPTDGSPLRGLIQDHVDSGVLLTKRDTFLERWEYQQLLFAALVSLPGLEVIDSDMDIEMLPPAILKPRELWTGKQVISTLLRHLRMTPDSYSAQRRLDKPLPGLSCERKAKTPPTAFGEWTKEHLVVVRDGELLQGVLDKAAFGSTDFSLVHAAYEAYGPGKAGLLLNILGRVFTAYLQQYVGHSCRMEDLILTPQADKERKGIVRRAYNAGARAAKAWADSDGGKLDLSMIKDDDTPMKPVEVATAAAKIEGLLSGKEGTANRALLDGHMQSKINPLASEIIKACLPHGLAVPFPKNSFGLMVTTGAKGSTVNQSQVSCALGQQTLEGQRVPRMSSGRTLPSFAPYDPNPRADGFIADRFLTGIRPQEYYFHCMAGREGLVDTAVKTSRSGYLQRCLVKHLEELKVCYDNTVRDGEGGVVQFLYGEDGIDPTKAAHLECSTTTLQFMARNHDALRRRYTALPHSTLDIAGSDFHRNDAVSKGGSSPDLLMEGSFVKARKLRYGSEWKRGCLCHGWFDAVITKRHSDGRCFDISYVLDKTKARNVPLEVRFAFAGSKNIAAASRECVIIKPGVPEPILSDNSRYGAKHMLGRSGACVSERVAGATLSAISGNAKVQAAMDDAGVSGDNLAQLIAAKYSSAIVAPGEAVGSIAAQSVGEPSTQMTLNTFHLAGCAGANVTLGIPRLREIIMTASKELKTPTMSVPLHESVTDRDATRLTRAFTRLTLVELISSRGGIAVTETLEQSSSGIWERAYHVTLKLHSEERITEAFGLGLDEVADRVSQSFIPNLAKIMKMELKRSADDGDLVSTSVQGGKGSLFLPNESSTSKAKKRAKVDDEYEEEDAGDEDGVTGSRFGHKKEMASYGDMDDEEKAIAKASNRDEDMEGEVQENSSPPATVTDDEDFVENLDNSGNSVTIDRKTNSIAIKPLRVDPSARPLLMVGLVERAANTTVIRSHPKINDAFISDEEGRGRCLQTAGCNFEEFWELDPVDHNRLASNDTWALRCSYGVEAARMNIVEQIRSVFGVYGIEVDPRHLSLIADYMTYDGGYRPMNRTGMADISSSFLQMSFETTATFMVEAALNKRYEPMMSPSANIVLGRPVRHGTGAFECFVKP